MSIPGFARSKETKSREDSAALSPPTIPAALFAELPRAISVGAASAAHHATVAVRGHCFRGWHILAAGSGCGHLQAPEAALRKGGGQICERAKT
mmetsp:Transcript_40631/g.120503  ORF Transcript_40631/g.120503 Transcript_40631/m.120503 type:complete len:94 (-) Transcript_40631:7-288(-)